MTSKAGIVKLRFQERCVQISTSDLNVSKELLSTIKDSQKYLQIKRSIEVVGLVEPIVVVPDSNHLGKYRVLDGHLRLEALIELNVAKVLCLISKDDEAFTYNKHVNRLSAVQEHHMIVKANESGVSAEILANALGLSEVSIKQRFKLLKGICDEVINLLADKPVPRNVFPILKRMKPFRQIDVVNMMISLSNYSVKFANAMLQGTPTDQLIENKYRKNKNSTVTEILKQLEIELARVQEDTKLVEETYGPANLQLTIIKTHIVSLFDNARIVKWLINNNPDYFEQLQLIAELKNLAKS
jgi:ParB/RepB/Spo0J family partition protein